MMTPTLIGRPAAALDLAAMLDMRLALRLLALKAVCRTPETTMHGSLCVPPSIGTVVRTTLLAISVSVSSLTSCRGGDWLGVGRPGTKAADRAAHRWRRAELSSEPGPACQAGLGQQAVWLADASPRSARCRMGGMVSQKHTVPTSASTVSATMRPSDQ